jgi:HUS1 checkpoint protein
VAQSDRVAPSNALQEPDQECEPLCQYGYHRHHYHLPSHSLIFLPEFCASLASLGQIAWCRLNDDDVQFTIVPDKGSQVWSVLKIETVFDTYILQSASERNTINLEVPIQALSRALKSAYGATSTQLRLTKKDNVPMLSLTIITNTFSSGNNVVAVPTSAGGAIPDEFDFDDDFAGPSLTATNRGGPRERETIITQDIPVKVLSMEVVERIHQPRTQEPDVNIYLPPLAQVKTISERFTRLAVATSKSSSSTSPRLELSANMHGSLKISLKTDALNITSRWTGLTNPELDPVQFQDGQEGVRNHPSTKMKELGGPTGENEAGWSKVRIDAKDWSRVLSVGRVSARVIACFINDGGLVMYVYLPNDENGSEDESCLTVSLDSFSLFQRCNTDQILRYIVLHQLLC